MSAWIVVGVVYSLSYPGLVSVINEGAGPFRTEAACHAAQGVAREQFRGMVHPRVGVLTTCVRVSLPYLRGTLE